MIKIELHPEVDSELEKSRAWYAERSKKLGTEFTDTSYVASLMLLFIELGPLQFK